LDNFALNSESPSGSPTISPSLLPTTSPLPTGEQAIIMVSIEMDDAPQQTGWRIESSTTGTVVWEVQSFTYVTEYDVITETLSLDAGTEYDFVLTDSYGDGGPRAIIYFENKSTDNVLAFVDGSFFSESVTRFVASADGIVAFTLFPSTSPSVGPTPNPSMVPSLSRSPTITASPSGPITLVTLHIEFDGFPRETRWELVDHRGRIVQSTQYGEYFLANSTTTEKIYLSSGGTYTIKLFDSAHDGLCCDFGAGHATLFLGEKNGGQILMLHDGRFGSSVSWDFVVSGGALLANVTSFPSMTPLSSSVLPTQTAAPSSLLRTNITVVINLDNLPFETSWSLTTLNGRTLQQGLPGQYIAQGGEIMEVIEVEEDKEYIFQLTDTFGDGICCEYGGGDAAVYLGNEKNAEMMIVKDDGEYGFGRAHNFIASNNETFVAPTLPPSVTKTVITVYIQTDSFLPSETGWYVQSENGRVVRRARAGDYTRPGEVATLTFPATLGLWHNFTITDSASDGLCCRYGHGFAAVYLGTVMSPEFLLAYDDGQFGAERTHQFMASEEGIIGSTGAPSTTFSPSSVTAPSMSPFVPPPMSSHQPSATLTPSISNPPSVVSSSVSRKHMEEMSHIVVILGTIICFVF